MAEALTTQEQLVRVTLRIFFSMSQTRLLSTNVTLTSSSYWSFVHMFCHGGCSRGVMWCSKQLWPVRTLPSLLTPV